MTKTPPKKSAKSKSEPARKYCTQPDCKEVASSRGYCRLHYLANWKHIKFSRQVNAERRLNAFVDKLTKKYPKDYLEKIKEGLENEEKFLKTVEELDIQTSAENGDSDKEFLEKFLRIVKPGNE